MWNVGADFIFLGAHSLNANVQRLARHVHRLSVHLSDPGGYGDLGGEPYVDLNYVAKECGCLISTPASLRRTCSTTSNPIGMVVNNGVFHPRGRGLGFQVSKRF